MNKLKQVLWLVVEWVRAETIQRLCEFKGLNSEIKTKDNLKTKMVDK